MQYCWCLEKIFESLVTNFLTTFDLINMVLCQFIRICKLYYWWWLKKAIQLMQPVATLLTVYISVLLKNLHTIEDLHMSRFSNGFSHTLININSMQSWLLRALKRSQNFKRGVFLVIIFKVINFWIFILYFFYKIKS